VQNEKTIAGILTLRGGGGSRGRFRGGDFCEEKGLTELQGPGEKAEGEEPSEIWNYIPGKTCLREERGKRYEGSDDGKEGATWFKTAA